MEFQITEAVELIKTLAETENLTQREAFQVFVTEAGLDVEAASQVKAALFETYTLKEMASDSLTKALVNVFVTHEGVGSEDIHEVDTKETQEGTKYKVRVKDKTSGSSYIRYATREKVAELRANPNISSVEMTDYGTTGEDDRGDRTAAAKRGDRDGDGKVESGSKEHAGVVHNAIQRKMGGKPDGQDTRKEELEHIEENRRAARAAGGYKDDSKKQTDPSKAGFTGISGSIKDIMRQNKEIEASNKKKTKKEELELEEGKKDADLGKMKRQSNKHMKDAVGKRSKSDSDSKNKSFKMDGIRSAIERGEDPRRDTYNGKRTGKDGTHPPEDHRSSFTHSMKDRPAKEPGVKKESAWEQYLELREARAKTKEEATKKLNAHRAAMKDGGDSPYVGKIKDGEMVKKSDPWSTHASDAKAHRKEDQKEEWKPDPTEKRKAKSAKLGREEEIEKGKSKKYGRDEDKIKDLYKRRIAVDFKKKKSSIGEDLVSEADLVDAGRENQGERDKKKLTGKGVDNSTNVKLMPRINEAILTGSPLSISEKKLAGKLPARGIVADLAERMGIVAEECCPKCGTPECTCEGKKEEKPKKKREPKAKLDEAGMPIAEYVSTGPTKEMVAPAKDENGAPGVMNPKGTAKRYKRRGEAPGDRRPNDITGPDLPNEKGTVPNGSGV